MKWSEIGLILLAVSAVAGFFVVVTSQHQTVAGEVVETTETDPLALLEIDLAELYYGSGFRDVPSAPSDTIVKSMDLIDSISVHQANLFITRALRLQGFDHEITYSVPGRGLSFLFSSREGDHFRLELSTTRM